MALAQSGVFSTADAARVGVGSDELTSMARHREITRVRRGAYALSSVYGPAQPSDRYRLEVLAVLRTRRPEDRASHHSALALLGIDTYGVPARVITLESRKARRQKVQSGLVTHPWTGGDTWISRDFRTVPPALACVQVAAKYGFVPGVCAVDSALRKGLCTLQELEAAVLLVARRSLLLRSMLAAADPRADSVGETRTRIILTDGGFEVRSQVTIQDELGFVGRVDLLVDGVVVLEFDGLMKYAGVDGKEALAAEKAREERLTRLGYEVVRVTWSDLEDPVALIRRVIRARQVALQRRRATLATG